MRNAKSKRFIIQNAKVLGCMLQKSHFFINTLIKFNKFNHSGQTAFLFQRKNTVNSLVTTNTSPVLTVSLIQWINRFLHVLHSVHVITFCISYRITIIDQRSVSKKANNWLDSVNIYRRVDKPYMCSVCVCRYIPYIPISSSFSRKKRISRGEMWLLPVFRSLT